MTPLAICLITLRSAFFQRKRIYLNTLRRSVEVFFHHNRILINFTRIAVLYASRKLISNQVDAI